MQDRAGEPCVGRAGSLTALLRELLLQQCHRVPHHSLPWHCKMCFLCINTFRDTFHFSRAQQKLSGPEGWWWLTEMCPGWIRDVLLEPWWGKGQGKPHPRLTLVNPIFAVLTSTPLCSVVLEGRASQQVCRVAWRELPVPPRGHTTALALSCGSCCPWWLSSGTGHPDSLHPATPGLARLGAGRGGCTFVLVPELYQTLRDCSAGRETFQPIVHFVFK